MVRSAPVFVSVTVTQPISLVFGVGKVEEVRGSWGEWKGWWGESPVALAFMASVKSQELSEASIRIPRKLFYRPWFSAD